jgi:hypothetical protein
MQAIKELADRLDGKPAQMLEHSVPDSNPITKIAREIVHTYQDPEYREIDRQRKADGNGHDPKGNGRSET